MNRPNAALLAKWSYYLSYATSGFLALGFLLGFVRSPLSAILWLAFLTGAVGAFMAWAAKSEFKRQRDPDAAAVNFARQGWRVNLAGFVVLIVILGFMVVLRVVLSQFNAPIDDPALTPPAVLLFRI
jgi:hypothetical protein